MCAIDDVHPERADRVEERVQQRLRRQVERDVGALAAADRGHRAEVAGVLAVHGERVAMALPRRGRGCLLAPEEEGVDDGDRLRAAVEQGSTRWLPMNPAPPVTTTRAPS